MSLFRWKAVTPLALLLGLMVIGWYFLLDSAVRRTIELVGRDLVGAKVDLAEAHVRLADGSVVLRGLEVTNPDAPMTNLVQIDEIIAGLKLGPLLQKKSSSIQLPCGECDLVRRAKRRERSGIRIHGAVRCGGSSASGPVRFRYRSSASQDSREK